jgi:hypothetical protein
MPAASHPYLDWHGPVPFAHRGGASDAPENISIVIMHFALQQLMAPGAIFGSGDVVFF